MVLKLQQDKLICSREKVVLQAHKQMLHSKMQATNSWTQQQQQQQQQQQGGGYTS